MKSWWLTTVISYVSITILRTLHISSLIDVNKLIMLYSWVRGASAHILTLFSIKILSVCNRTLTPKWHVLDATDFPFSSDYSDPAEFPVISSLTADANHVWLVSRICCQILPVPYHCLDLCDPAGCPLTSCHMISVCDLWPLWIIKEAWPQADCIGNLSLMISELVWGK